MGEIEDLGCGDDLWVRRGIDLEVMIPLTILSLVHRVFDILIELAHLQHFLTDCDPLITI